MKYIQFFFLFGIFIAYSVGNLYKINFFSSEANATILDVFLTGSYLFLIVRYMHRVKELLREYNPVLKSFRNFVLIGLLGLSTSLFEFPPHQVFVGALYLLRFILYASTIIVVPLLYKTKQLNLVLKTISIAILVASAVQYVWYPDVRHLQVSEWDPHYYRVVGSLLDPGFTALILLFVFLSSWIRPFFSQKWLNLAFMFITYMLFSLTYSRSGYLAFVFSFGYLSLINKSPKIFIFAVSAILLTVFALPRSPGGEGIKLERTSSIEARIRNWKNSFLIFADHPIIGVGFNTYRYSQNKYGFLDKETWLKSHAGAGADSSLLFVAATTGLLGLIAYLDWVKKLWTHAESNHLVKASLVALSVHSVFLNSAFYPFIMFWIFISLSSKKTSSG